jgi:phospholipid/cholesterol/gamma-HCH transport system substrate-binding protein
MERNKLDLWVGMFVVAGIASLVMLALKVGNLSTYNVSETYQVQAYFANIGGLKPKASVRSAGVLVGRVTDISLDKERYEAKVTIRFVG